MVVPYPRCKGLMVLIDHVRRYFYLGPNPSDEAVQAYEEKRIRTEEEWQNIADFEKRAEERNAPIHEADEEGIIGEFELEDYLPILTNLDGNSH